MFVKNASRATSESLRTSTSKRCRPYSTKVYTLSHTVVTHNYLPRLTINKLAIKMTTSFTCHVQTLIESVIKDTQELQTLHKESRKRKIEKVHALKKRHETLLRSKNKLHTVKLDIEDAHRKLQKGTHAGAL